MSNSQQHDIFIYQERCHDNTNRKGILNQKIKWAEVMEDFIKLVMEEVNDFIKLQRAQKLVIKRS